MEKAVLMMDYLNVTQKSNSSFSHRGDKALDIAGKDNGIDSSFNYRTRIASANGIVNYMGTSVQNTYLLNLLKQGKLIRP